MNRQRRKQTPNTALLPTTKLRRKINYFVLESSTFGVKTSPCMENTEPENKMQLSSTNFQDRK